MCTCFFRDNAPMHPISLSFLSADSLFFSLLWSLIDWFGLFSLAFSSVCSTHFGSKHENHWLDERETNRKSSSNVHFSPTLSARFILVLLKKSMNFTLFSIFCHGCCCRCCCFLFVVRALLWMIGFCPDCFPFSVACEKSTSHSHGLHVELLNRNSFAKWIN